MVATAPFWRILLATMDGGRNAQLSNSSISSSLPSVYAEWAVELGAEDPVLEVPWAAGEGAPRYLDLKRRPELLLEVAETAGNPELAEFLAAANASNFPLETAKCDTWSTRELSEEEAIFGATEKFASYVDLLFSDAAKRSDF